MQPTIHNMTQGSSEWLAYRSKHLNASDAPAMMGASKYRSRTSLIREVATGITEEVDDAKQRLFDRGHAAEAAIRPMIEKLIDDELYPATLSREVEGLPLSASMDGWNMDGDTAFECKLWNEDLAAQVRAGELAPHYYWQLEQQILVSGANRVIFATGDGVDRLETMEYRAVPGRAEQLIAGWIQFQHDVAAYVPEVAKVEAIGRTRMQLPALRIEATGLVTSSNLAEFKAASMAVLETMDYELVTDQDFADADNDIKYCKSVEDGLEAAKRDLLSSTADLDAVFRTMDEVAAEARRMRLLKTKAVSTRKDARRAEIVQMGRDAIQAHYDQINATLGAHAIQFPATGVVADLGAAIKGKKTLASMQDAVNSTVANAKIAASQQADRVRANVAILTEHAEHESLFADRVQLCASKTPEDLRNLVSARINEHKLKEQARIDAEREKIRLEEAAKLQREQEERDAEAARQAETPAPAPQIETDPRMASIVEHGMAGVDFSSATGSTTLAAQAPAAAAKPGARIRLGEINDAIAPLKIDTDGLAQLGFLPVATDRAAKLYDAGQFRAMCIAMRQTLADAANKAAGHYQKAA